jgi:hypothetical protein
MTLTLGDRALHEEAGAVVSLVPSANVIKLFTDVSYKFL